MSKIQVFYEDQIVKAGSPASDYETRLDLGNEVKKVLGYYLLVINAGGLIPEQCRLSYSNSGRTIFKKAGLGHFRLDYSVPIKDRFFREEPFEINGFVNSKLTIPAVPLTDVVIQHVLLTEVD